MTLREFHNGLRIMISIDMYELEEAGVIEVGDMETWTKFRDDPYAWFIRAGPAQADAFWKIMEARGA